MSRLRRGHLYPRERGVPTRPSPAGGNRLNRPARSKRVGGLGETLQSKPRPGKYFPRVFSTGGSPGQRITGTTARVVAEGLHPKRATP